MKTKASWWLKRVVVEKKGNICVCPGVFSWKKVDQVILSDGSQYDWTMDEFENFRVRVHETEQTIKVCIVEGSDVLSEVVCL